MMVSLLLLVKAEEENDDVDDLDDEETGVQKDQKQAVLTMTRARELLELGADPNCFVREGNTAILALATRNKFVHSAFASAELYRLACDRPEGCVERHSVNSHMQTALDHVQQAAGDSATLTEYLKQNGALSFEDSAPAAEELWNERVREACSAAS
ncbi:hypothetical protein AK812_SmicGene44912 [Symbiodinium microadriaticum]|uniref:Uncharacterized protein n=1 Tax=Symbiodinium microadriaticum TaxID=2951 RepID=A0A1Q9BXC1_SYMMI|nr:hypothetical protein AK812_SmicGene44912 [Symbiodinium microadriaticum]